MNTDYVVYDASGRIVKLVNCPENMARIQKKANEKMIVGLARIGLDYVVDGVVTERPDNPAFLVGRTLHDVPIPSDLSIGPDVYELTNPTVELDLPLSGKYFVKLSSFPYKDKHFEVVV